MYSMQGRKGRLGLLTSDKLQRVLNAAARVVSDTRKFDRGLTSLLHDELHWLGCAREGQFIQSVTSRAP